MPPVDIGILAAKGSLYLTRPTPRHLHRQARRPRDVAADLFDVVQKRRGEDPGQPDLPAEGRRGRAHRAGSAENDRQHGAAAVTAVRPARRLVAPATATPGTRRSRRRRAGRITPRRTRLTALIVACALFMQNLDCTVIATALPTMARAFGADPVQMNVALTSYLLSLAVFIPASGWMADRFGARTVFRAAIAVFTLGSILCGAPTACAFLVAARILQGIGGAMMVPVGRLVLLRTRREVTSWSPRWPG